MTIENTPNTSVAGVVPADISDKSETPVEDSDNPLSPASITKRISSDAKFWYQYERYPYLLAKLAVFGTVLYSIIWSLQNVQSVLFPLFLSLLIAYCLDPLVDWFEAKGINRTIAISLLILLSALSTVGFILIVAPVFQRELSRTFEKLPELVTLFQEKVLPWIEAKTNQELPDNLSAAIASYGEEIQSALPSISKHIGSIVSGIFQQSGIILTAALNAVMIPLFTFYFLRDFDIMKDPLVKFIPPQRRKFIMSRILTMDEVVGAWFRGQIEVALILAALYSIGLGIAFSWAGMGFMTGFAIGLMAGLLNAIPYFGLMIGMIVTTVMLLLNGGESLSPLLFSWCVFGAVQGLEGWIITPRIVGDKVGLSPVTVIIVLLLGGELFGLLGIVLAIPIAGVIRALIPDFIAYYKQTGFFTSEFRGPDDANDWVETIEALRDALRDADEEGERQAITEEFERACPDLAQAMRESQELKSIKKDRLEMDDEVAKTPKDSEE